MEGRSMPVRLCLLIVAIMLGAARVASAQPPSSGEATASAASRVEKIAWFGTLASARAEAARTQRPIFLLAARPECRGVPGYW